MSSARDGRSSGPTAASVTGLVGAWVAVLSACKEPASSPATATDHTALLGSAAGSGDAAAPQPLPPDAPAPAPTIVHHEPSVVVMAEPTLDLPKQESFRLLEAGHGARSTLRYTLAAGTVAFTARTTLSSRHFDLGQLSAPLVLPAIRDGFAITTTADHPGRLALRGLAGEAAAPSADADAYLARWRAQLQDRRATLTLDDRGGFTAITFDDDPAGARSERARDELVQRLLSTIIPLPAEPVAAGARWRVVTILRQPPAYAKQTATYTLTSRGPRTWKLHVTLQRVGEEQHLSDPALPRGTSADLLALFRSLEGDVELDPTRPLIAGGSFAIESRMHVRLQDAGQPATEQMFEDTGTIVFSVCRPLAAPAAPPPTGAHDRFGACPAGFASRP